MSRRWGLGAPDALSWREWDGDAVVFNRRSGSTHRLDVLSAQVLRLVTPAAMSEAALAAALARFLEVNCDGELVAMAHNLVGQLADLGLVERVR